MDKEYLEDWDEFAEYDESEYEESEFDESEYDDQEYEESEYEEQASFAQRHPDEADTTYVGPGYNDEEELPSSRKPHSERVRLTPEERQERKRKRKQQVRIMKILIAAGVVIALLVVGIGVRAIVKHFGNKDASNAETQTAESVETQQTGDDESTDFSASENTVQENSGMTVVAVSDNTVSEDSVSEDSVSENGPAGDEAAAYYAINGITDAQSMSSPEVTSEYGILVNTTKRQVVAQKRGNERMIPASMTKVLTLLVAAEHVTDLDDTFTITIDVTDYSYSNDCSAAGFDKDEVVTVKDLLYGTILPSGGDAAYALACYVAGSHEAFVDMMNQKLSDLGLGDTTHFVNCVGIYDDDHYSTPYDMAVIMEAAMDNDLCREVLTTRTYKTSQTPQHPDGIPLSNLFNRRIEDYDIKGELLGAKTGFVNESGNCAVSCYKGSDGDEYVCVMAGAKGAWRCIYDHVAAYQIYAAGNTGYTKEKDLTKVEGAP